LTYLYNKWNDLRFHATGKEKNNTISFDLNGAQGELKMKKKFQMIEVNYPGPHIGRTQSILKSHPELKKLFGNTPSTAFFVFGVVALQVALAIYLGTQSFWVILLASYCIGAFANHALWVLIHECTHNLIFRGNAANSLLQIFANLPIIFPSAISFRIYHIKHHLYQGELDRDADLPRPFEVKWVGNSTFKKSLWYFLYFASQLLRVPFLKGIPFFNGWVALNLVVEVGFLAGLTYFFGWQSFLYLALSSIFSIGLHPVGARWIQEHYVIYEMQETYSYYGPLNKIAFNVGYHNEHHDFMSVPWSRLPKVRAIATEHYDSLYYHTSWSYLLYKFLTDPSLGLFSRVTRPSAKTRIKPA
jgi:sphingolipid delta-4 desaturase